MRQFLKIASLPVLVIIWALVYLLSSLDRGFQNILLVVPVSVLIVFVGALIIYRDLKKEKSNQDSTDRKPPTVSSVKKEIFVFALVATYLVVFEKLGFILSTFLFFIAILWLLGVRKPVVVLFFSGVSTFVLQLVFSNILQVPLPTGFFTLWSW